MFAERYGWTPDQVDSLPLDVAPWLIPIARAIDDEQKRRDDADNRAREAEMSVKTGGVGRP